LPQGNGFDMGVFEYVILKSRTLILGAGSTLIIENEGGTVIIK
jgi:hypothetical protein